MVGANRDYATGDCPNYLEVITEITSNVRRPRIIPVRVIIDGKPVLQRPAMVYINSKEGKVPLGQISSPGTPSTLDADACERTVSQEETAEESTDINTLVPTISNISMESTREQTTGNNIDNTIEQTSDEPSEEERIEARAAAIAAAVEVATEAVSAEEAADFVTVREFVQEQISPTLLNHDVVGAPQWAR